MDETSPYSLPAIDLTLATDQPTGFSGQSNKGNPSAARQIPEDSAYIVGCDLTTWGSSWPTHPAPQSTAGTSPTFAASTGRRGRSSPPEQEKRSPKKAVSPAGKRT